MLGIRLLGIPSLGIPSLGIPSLGIPDVGYSVQLPMTFHSWAFHCWVFRSFCPEYPMTKIPNFSVGYSGRWVFRTVTVCFYCCFYSFMKVNFIKYFISNVLNKRVFCPNFGGCFVQKVFWRRCFGGGCFVRACSGRLYTILYLVYIVYTDYCTL